MTEGVVHVEDAGIGCAQPLHVDGTNPRVDRGRVKRAQLEDLGRAVDSSPAGGDVPDTARGLDLDPALAQPLAVLVLVEDLARAEVEPVLTRRAAVPELQLLTFLLEVGVVVARPFEDLGFEIPRGTAEHVDQAVGVGGDEVHGGLTHLQLVHRRGDGKPPPARHSCVTEVAAADHAQTDVTLVLLDRLEGGVESRAPRFMEPLPVILTGSGGLASGLVGQIDVLQGPVELVPFDLVGDQ